MIKTLVIIVLISFLPTVMLILALPALVEIIRETKKEWREYKNRRKARWSDGRVN